MVFEKTDIPAVILVKPRVFEDERGYFFESFKQSQFADAGIDLPFVQDNQSKSGKGIVRGLHFQVPPHEQGKLVRVIQGAIIDVAVDIRKDSSTFGQHVAVELNEDNKHMLWVPPGFAHGFSTLTDDTVVSYKCTKEYHHESEGCIRWDSLDIDWKVKDAILSAKDAIAVEFSAYESPF